MNTKSLLMAAFVAVFVALAGCAGVDSAGDQWFVLSEQTLDPAQSTVEIKSSGGRWEKDVKQVKLSVEGADVQITNLVLHWDNRPDDTFPNVGTVVAGGETSANNAPGMKARLKGVTVSYVVQGSGPATLRVWGYD